MLWVCETLKKEKALVLLSGGQDSITCLGWAKKTFGDIEALSFYYGQTHIKEINIASQLCRMLNVPWSALPLDLYKHLSTISSLLVQGDNNKEDEVTITTGFVPGRNLLFLLVASIIAFTRETHHIVIGARQIDYAGYPDCRDDTIKSLQSTLSLGFNYEFIIHTPLMWLTKAETWKLSTELGVTHLVEAYSWTCYKGKETPCGTCPACINRNKGYREAVEKGWV